MKKLFEDMEDLCIKKLGSTITYNGQGEFQIMRDGDKVTVGYCTAIEDAYDDKGIPFNNVKVILFDEFIDYSYFKDEIAMFRHTIANVVRDEEKQGVIVIMLGNTVSKHCPYFDYFGFNISKIRQGEIAEIRANAGGHAVAEWTKTKVGEDGGKKRSKYFGFDGVGSDMILHGSWEYNECNTKEVDGIGWNSKRARVNAYVTGLENVYEMSYRKGANPIAFVRSINTQKGLVARDIRYNISFDNSLNLYDCDGKCVPKYRKISEYMDGRIYSELQLIDNCIKCGRIVFENEQVGTEFMLAFKGVH